MTTGPLPLLSIADLADLPPREQLIDGMLPEAGMFTLYGPSGSGKTFLELDWGLCIAAGIPWYGREVKQGPVVCIIAEGASGIYQRVQAWLDARDQTPPADIHFAGAVNFMSRTEVASLKAAIDQLPDPPILIVVDTLARCMVGGDENSAKDVGLFINALDELAKPYNAARLVIHHTGKSGDDERGSTALRGASDTMLKLAPDGASIRLSCDKQKDSPEFDPWTVHLQTVGESCVLRLGTNTGVLGASERQLLETVSVVFGTNWTSGTALRDASNATKSTYYRAMSALVRLGYIEQEPTAKRPRLRLTEQGQTALVPPSPTESHGTSLESPTVHHSLRSGTGTRPGTNGRASLDAQTLDYLQSLEPEPEAA
jgi:hypothetical protein